MGWLARSLVLVGVGACCCAMAWNVGGHLHATAAQQRWAIRVTRVYPGPDGQSHAEEMEMKLGVADKLGLEQSEAVKVSSANFVRFPANFLEDWHQAHARRYVITLTGRGEAEIGGGQRIAMEPGRVVLFEDTSGKGHISRALTADWTAVFVQLEEQSKEAMR